MVVLLLKRRRRRRRSGDEGGRRVDGGGGREWWNVAWLIKVGRGEKESGEVDSQLSLFNQPSD